MAPARLHSLDSLRGAAALSVVICHSLIFLFRSAPWLSVPLSIPPLSLFVTASGAVILFFVLSGYVLALSLGELPLSEWGTFIIRRVLRIWPTYLVVILSAALLAFATQHAGLTPPPGYNSPRWHRLDLHTVLIEGLMARIGITLDPIAHTLVHEMRISLIFPLILVGVRRVPLATFGISLVLFVAVRAGPAWLQDIVPDTAAFVVYFVAGAWLAHNRHKLMVWANAIRSKRVITAAAIVFLSLPFGGRVAEIVPGFGAVLLLGLAVCSQDSNLLNNPWLLRLGMISYSLYLMHLVVLMSAGLILGRWLPMPAVLALAIPIVFLLSWFLYRYVERPSIVLGRRLTLHLRRRIGAPLNGSATSALSR